MKSRRGFILTLDAMLALFIATMMVMVILEMSQEPDIRTEDYLYSFAVDFLTVAEKDESLRDVLRGNSTRLNSMLYGNPDNMCLNVTILDDDLNVVFSNQTQCGPAESAVHFKRSFPYGTDFYVAELEVWYR